MDQIHAESDSLSLKNYTIDEEEEDNERDIITIKLGLNTIKVNFSQLCKYSQLIRDEYLISDAQTRLSEELQQLQQENHIDYNNFDSFFKLIQDDDVSMSNDKYKDFLKLSEFFKVKKLIIQLKKYFISHLFKMLVFTNIFVNEKFTIVYKNF